MGCVRRQQPSYRWALIFAAINGLGTYGALAAGRHSTLVTAIPYAVGSTVLMALFIAGLVAYTRR